MASTEGGAAVSRGSPPAVSPDTRLPLYQRLRDDILAKIAARVWLPGEALPAEQLLAEDYGVALGTMRKALETLVHDGFLERRQGKGTYVRKADFSRSLFRFFRLTDKGGEQLTPKARVLGRRQRRASAVVAEHLALPVGTPVIHLRRLRLVNDEPLLDEDIWVPAALFGALMEIPTKDYGDLLYPLYERVCGQIVARARERLTVEIATAPQARALAIETGDPVIVIERTACDFDERALEWRCSRGPAAKFNYGIEIR